MYSSWDPRVLLEDWLLCRGLSLTYTAWDLDPFAKDCGYDGPPFIWDEARRFLIRYELDAAFFHLYLGSESEWRESGSTELLEYFPTPRRAVEYIMETFPIVKRKDIARTADENGENGRYITKDRILEIYDEMANVIEANVVAKAAGKSATAQYQTCLDPPPGPPTNEAGNFIPMAQWTDTIWQRYKNLIHPPRHIPVPTTPPEQVKLGRAIAYINLLLHTWGKPVVREALETGLVFMLNDSIRQRVLRGVRPLGKTASRSKGQIVSGMDSVLSNLQANDAINTSIKTGRMVITLGRKPVSVAKSTVC